MQTWGEAYRRLRAQRKFTNFFGHMGRVPGPNDFVFRAFCMRFETVTGAVDDDQAPVFGPQVLTFDKGAIVLGVTSGAYQFTQPMRAVEPSPTPGRRDTYMVSLRYTEDEKITPDQNIMDPAGSTLLSSPAFLQADALQGNGIKDEFARELMVPPSQGISVSVQSLQPSQDTEDEDVPPLTVHVVFHVVVPRG